MHEPAGRGLVLAQPASDGVGKPDGNVARLRDVTDPRKGGILELRGRSAPRRRHVRKNSRSRLPLVQ